MKNFGCVSEYHRERTRDLLRAYFRYLESCSFVSMPDVFRKVVDMPASRFWVSASRAAVVIASILHGDKLLYMRPNKREMFFEIFNRVEKLRLTYPEWPTPKLIDAVLAQPAPKFYLAPGSARVLILKARKQWFAQKSKKRSGC